MTYDNINSHNKPGHHPSSRRYILGKTKSVGQIDRHYLIDFINHLTDLRNLADSYHNLRVLQSFMTFLWTSFCNFSISLPYIQKPTEKITL